MCIVGGVGDVIEIVHAWKHRIHQAVRVGVYAGWAIVDGKKYKAGIMYRNGTTILEAYILDFSGDIYGKKMELEIGKKIREIIRFENDRELIAQIKKDVKLIKDKI